MEGPSTVVHNLCNNGDFGSSRIGGAHDAAALAGLCALLLMAASRWYPQSGGATLLLGCAPSDNPASRGAAVVGICDAPSSRVVRVLCNNPSNRDAAVVGIRSAAVAGI